MESSGKELKVYKIYTSKNGEKVRELSGVYFKVSKKDSYISELANMHCEQKKGQHYNYKRDDCNRYEICGLYERVIRQCGKKSCCGFKGYRLEIKDRFSKQLEYMYFIKEGGNDGKSKK